MTLVHLRGRTIEQDINRSRAKKEKTHSLPRLLILRKNWGSNLHEVFQLPVKPKNLDEMINILVSSNDFDKLLATGNNLMSKIRILLTNSQKRVSEEKPLDKKDLVHMKEYFNKIIDDL